MTALGLAITAGEENAGHKPCYKDSLVDRVRVLIDKSMRPNTPPVTGRNGGFSNRM